MTQKKTTNSATVVFRGDMRLLAAIALFYRENGEQIETRGGLIRQIVKDFHAFLIATKQILPIEETETAMSILTNLGYDRMTAGGQYESKLINRIVAERQSPVNEKPVDQEKFKQAISIFSQMSDEEVEGDQDDSSQIH